MEKQITITEIQRYKNWICFTNNESIFNPNRLNATTINQNLASSDDSNTWGTYKRAWSQIWTSNKENKNKELKSIGFIITKNIPICCLQIHNAYIDNEITPETKEIIKKVNSYCEKNQNEIISIWGTINKTNIENIAFNNLEFIVTGQIIEYTGKQIGKNQNLTDLTKIFEYIKTLKKEKESELNPTAKINIKNINHAEKAITLFKDKVIQTKLSKQGENHDKK